MAMSRFSKVGFFAADPDAGLGVQKRVGGQSSPKGGDHAANIGEVQIALAAATATVGHMATLIKNPDGMLPYNKATAALETLGQTVAAKFAEAHDRRPAAASDSKQVEVPGPATAVSHGHVPRP